ncbi:hypothetical protein [Micromonospora sp. NPDC093277]|uniref:hypothetical protein n=1 Tax=Micromonospora sp. NPDC093277 TaxID=3364291 RepID=UPI00381527F5
MAFPRRYPPDLINAVVQRVADARTARAYGAVTSVAQQMGLERRLVQKWVNHATSPPPPRPAAAGSPPETYVLAGLLHCRFCHHGMLPAEPHDPVQGYRCRPDCRPRPIDAAAIADSIGRAILRYAPRIIPTRGRPTPPHLAATYADRVLARITVGAAPGDLTLTWYATGVPEADLAPADHAHRIDAVRRLAVSDRPRARQLLTGMLAGVNPATVPAHPRHAEAAALLAQLHLRDGYPNAATTWATYAHRSTLNLHGPTHPRSLDALHLLATAHQHAGHQQRAHHLYRELADHLTHAEGPHAHRTLATRATIAVVLHALGHCQPARTLLADTIATHRREHPGHPATAHMTQHLTRIWHDCDTKGHHHIASDDSPVLDRRPAP